MGSSPLAPTGQPGPLKPGEFSIETTAPVAALGQPGPMRAGEFTPSVSANQINFRLTDVTPPSNLYMQRDDTFSIVAASDFASLVLTISGRYLRPSDSVIVPFRLEFGMPGTNYTIAAFNFSLAEGYLLSMGASTNSGVGASRTYVRAFFSRSNVQTGDLRNVSQLLFADYVKLNNPTGWPSSRMIAPTDGAGRILANTIAAPAAGADFNVSVPGAARWRPVSYHVRLVTSAAAGNRNVGFIFGVGGVTIVGAPASVPPSTTQDFHLAPGLANITDARGVIQIPLPSGLIVGPAQNVSSLTANKDAADQWSIQQSTVEEWLEF